MKVPSWAVLPIATALVTAAGTLTAGGAGVAGAAAVTRQPARHAALASTVARDGEHDLAVVSPATVDLSAPPFVTSELTITYGQQVTLDAALDDVPAADLEQYIPGRVPRPSGGRYVAFRVTVTNTGSQDAGLAFFQPTTSKSEDFGYTDATLRGCGYLYPAPGKTGWLAPGHSHTGCTVFEISNGVTVTGARADMGFNLPSARGQWRITGHEPAARRYYVALGDSYSSGEGSGDYGKADPGCHRGANAWPRLLARALPALLKMPPDGLIACSGAKSSELLGKELRQLATVWPRPKLITLTMGGDDIGFPEILTACVKALRGNCDKVLKDAEGKLPAEEGTLEHDYTTIRKSEPQARLIVVGYPMLFPPSIGDAAHGGCSWWLTGPKLAGLDELNANLDHLIAKAAGEAHVDYKSIPGALDGHWACTADSWIYPIPKLDLDHGWWQQDGHPTLPGQEAIARQVESYITSHFPA